MVYKRKYQKISSVLLAITVSIFIAINAQGVESAKVSSRTIVDLTHPLSEDMVIWPGGVPFRITQLVDYDQGFLFHKFEMGENTGTHVDAPSHFIEGKRAIDEISVSELIIPAVVMDVQDKVANNPDYQLSASDILAWENKYKKIPSGSLVILNTGWYKRFNNPEKYINIDNNQVMHFPGFGIDSAKLLLKRNVVGIGIDTLSIDRGSSEDFATHHIMLEANKYQIENLTNLDRLPPTGATVIVGVLPVKNGSQAQARILGLLP